MVLKKFLGVQISETPGTVGIEFDDERNDSSKYEIVAGDSKMRISRVEFMTLQELMQAWNAAQPIKD